MDNFYWFLYNDNAYKYVSKNLKQIRKAFGFSQEKLGNYVGVTRQTIRNVEDGATPLKRPLYIALMAILQSFALENQRFMDIMLGVRKTNEIISASIMPIMAEGG